MPITQNAEPVLECTDVGVRLDGLSVLSGIDFALSPGEFVVLLGDNGAGKSTLVKAALGLLRLESGRVKLFGIELRRFRAWERIGYVPQRVGAVSPVPATVGEVVLSGRASLSTFSPGYSRRDRVKAKEALEAVKLENALHRPVRSLSGGQQQRVLIARALSREPEVLILDEPAAAIDADSQEALAETLGALSRDGRTVLMVAHGLGPLADLVSRTVVLDAGRVVYEGPAVGARAGQGHLHIHHHPDPHHAEPVFREGPRPLR